MFESLVLIAVYLTFEGVAVLFAMRAIQSARTPQGATGWVIFLLSAPHFAVPAYMFLGHSRYPGYVSARRDLRQTLARANIFVTRHGVDGTATTEQVGPRRAFERLADLPVAPGNQLSLLLDAEAAFGAIGTAIRAAQTYVLVQFYTLRDDDAGRMLADLLVAKSAEGVPVHVLYDAIGSSGLPAAYLSRLRDAGVQIRDFHAIRRSRSRFQLNFRNHRKIVVVDGATGFTGGMNVGDEYFGRNLRLGDWRDTMVQATGPVVSQLQLSFAEDWLWASGHQPDLRWDAAPVSGGCDALVLAPGPSDAMESGSLYFCNAIAAAQARIWIASPYFVPDGDILSSLKTAALRGVQVRLLLPAARDHWLVWLAAHAYFDEVRAAGVEIWRYNPGFVHQKVVLVDDEIASVGSINLDNRSCKLNFEVTLLAFDAAFAAKVAAMLTRDFESCQRYTTPLRKNPSFVVRNGARLARLFAPLL